MDNWMRFSSLKISLCFVDSWTHPSWAQSSHPPWLMWFITHLEVSLERSFWPWDRIHQCLRLDLILVASKLKESSCRMKSRCYLDNFYKRVACCCGYGSGHWDFPSRKNLLESWRRVHGSLRLQHLQDPFWGLSWGWFSLAALDKFWAWWGAGLWLFLCSVGPFKSWPMFSAQPHPPSPSLIVSHLLHLSPRLSPPTSIASLSLLSFSQALPHCKHLAPVTLACPVPPRGMDATYLLTSRSSHVQPRQQNPRCSLQIETQCRKCFHRSWKEVRS